MRIAKFETIGLDEAEAVLAKCAPADLSEADICQLLKVCSISFVLEDINRLQSMLICELKDSYVQQSQRYVRLDSSGYSLPPEFDAADRLAASEMISRLFSLYERMAEKKPGDFKGRPKKEQYVYGISIEDARYILPLAARTNVCLTMSGDKLVDFYRLCRDGRYVEILAEIATGLMEQLPPHIVKALANLPDVSVNLKMQAALYQPYFDKISDNNNMVLLAHFADMDGKTGLGAVTSTNSRPPSEVWSDWGQEAADKARGITGRVLGYGHTSIAEQARATTGMMCSLVTYHQQLRHRLTSNVREELAALLEGSLRPAKCPESIKNSKFAAEFQLLADEVSKFRVKISRKYGEQAALYFLLNCNQIKVIINANARADAAILSERTCMNAQWEIRELAVKKVRQLRNISQFLYDSALPACVNGSCQEGKMSCGRALEVKMKFSKLVNDKAGENG